MVSIGDFVKALRHNHDRPARASPTDSDSGYRHYDPAQVPIAHGIHRLRECRAVEETTTVAIREHITPASTS
jgi:hypothetical protein